MRVWGALGAAIVSEVAAALALKAALDQPAWYALVVAGYLSAFTLLTVCLRLGLPIGVAYGVWGAGGVTLTALLSAVLFAEALTAQMGLGMALIVAGVLTVELGAQRARREETSR
ncbi:QacE family quaternary ammonium compound efflux SMR transporter [Desertihabitans brevis]|uniref:QacE family quaternary ammonium compound efflux SMR transporter n=1 Tax=Desertihabitans brevis TaxID=2268447 RepID=A0A367YTJ0_9ACTN|nr:SMR family transporter [Desertihabitans brevis]RCK69203.1 QacE family quaternary ammonium compound efflux SMR transporter [Desertihabitans brevis]